MGTWSREPFGNDTANDWAYGLEDVKDLSYVEAALDKVLAVGDDYLEAPDAEEAIAAVEVLAKLLGRETQSDAYTEKVDEWVKKFNSKPNPALCNKARQVLQRIQSENSEIVELWEEAEEAEEWRKSLEQLRSALEA